MILAIIQARMNSSRLPGKVLMEVCGKPLIGHLLERLKRSREINGVVVATTDSAADDTLCVYLKKINQPFFRGSEEDVLDRYYQAARPRQPNAVARVTGDCPLIDPQVVDDVITLFRQGEWDYASNIEPPTFPDGLDFEIFKMGVLSQAWQNAREKSLREHVTLWMRQNPALRRCNFKAPQDYSSKRWTVDRPEDFQVVKSIIETLYPRKPAFTFADILQLEQDHPDIFKINRQFRRNEALKADKAG